jgi:hypothetical protein
MPVFLNPILVPYRCAIDAVVGVCNDFKVLIGGNDFEGSENGC